MSVTFKNNSSMVVSEIKSSIKGFLDEAGGELRSQTQRNSRVDTGQTKGSYDYNVQEETGKSTVHVGSNLENAVWEEYGTGEYAVNGDGRKGGWVYKDAKGNYYHTYGKTANEPMKKAFNSSKSKIKQQMQNVLKNL